MVVVLILTIPGPLLLFLICSSAGVLRIHRLALLLRR